MSGDALICLDEPNRISQEGTSVENEFSQSMENRLNKGYVLPGQTRLLYGCMETIYAGRRRNGRCGSDIDYRRTDCDGNYIQATDYSVSADNLDDH